MSEFEQLLEEIKELRARVERLEADTLSDYYALPMNAVVTVKQASERLGIAGWALKRGKLIPRYSNKPIKFIKQDVEKFFTAKREEMRKMMQGRPVKRKGLIRKSLIRKDMK